MSVAAPRTAGKRKHRSVIPAPISRKKYLTIAAASFIVVLAAW